MAQNPVNLFLGFAMQVRRKFEIGNDWTVHDHRPPGSTEASGHDLPGIFSRETPSFGAGGGSQGILTHKCFFSPTIASDWRKETSRRQWVFIGNLGRSSSRLLSSSPPVAMWQNFLASYRLFLFLMSMMMIWRHSGKCVWASQVPTGCWLQWRPSAPFTSVINLSSTYIWYIRICEQLPFPGNFLLSQPRGLTSRENPPLQPRAPCILSTDPGQTRAVKVFCLILKNLFFFFNF